MINKRLLISNLSKFIVFEHFFISEKKMHGVPPLYHKSEHKKGQKKKKQPKTNQKHTRRAQTRATSLFKGPKGPSQPKTPREKKPTKNLL